MLPRHKLPETRIPMLRSLDSVPGLRERKEKKNPEKTVITRERRTTVKGQELKTKSPSIKMTSHLFDLSWNTEIIYPYQFLMKNLIEYLKFYRS